MVAHDDIAFYRASERIAPDARCEERERLLDLLEIEPHHVVCDVPAWGGYLARGISDPSRVICLDSTAGIVHCPGSKIIQCSMNGRLSLRDGTVDRVGSLVGLHHLFDRSKFLHETYRILRFGGILALAEVAEGSKVAAFLNGPVHEYSYRGHRGTFLKTGELTAMISGVGFSWCSERLVPLQWQFDSHEQMVLYCKTLFQLTKASEDQVARLIEEHFDVTMKGDATTIDWALIYGAGRKQGSR